MTNAIRIFLVFFLAYFGFKVVTEDFKSGRISNKKIILGFKVLAFGFAVLFLVSLTNYLFLSSPKQVNSVLFSEFIKFASWLLNPSLVLKFYLMFFIHSFLVLFIALLFWKVKIWPAGDAKLYIVLGLIIPLISPAINQFPEKLFLVLLVNTFVPAGCFFVGHLLLKLTVKLMAGRYDKKFSDLPAKLVSKFKSRSAGGGYNLYSWGLLAVSYFAIFSFLQFLNRHIHSYATTILSDPLVIFAVLFLTWDLMYRYMMRKKTAAIFLAMLGIYATVGIFMFPYRISDDLTAGISMTVRFALFVAFFKMFVGYHFEKVRKHSVEVKNLSKGMILSTETLNLMKQDGAFYQDCFDTLYSDGLTAVQVEKVKRWNSMSHMEIIKAKPFALWLWLGAVLTLLMGMDLFNFISTKFSVFTNYFSHTMR